MSWGEAYRLTRLLMRDPSSQVAAAIEGWNYALSREGIALADLVDSYTRVHKNPRAKFKPHDRPWPDPSRERNHMGKITRSQRDIRAALRARGH